MNSHRNGLTYRGRPVDIVDLTSTVLMVFVLSWAFGSASLEALGMTHEAAGRYALLILPALLMLVKMIRFAVSLTVKILTVIRVVASRKKGEGR